MEGKNNYKSLINKEKIINNSIIATITVVLSVIILFCLYTVLNPVLFEEKNIKYSPSNETKKYTSRIEEALDKVSSKYVDEIDMDKLVDGALKGITAATDDVYTRYVSEEEYKEMLTSGTETYGGIGIHLTYDTNNNAIMVLGVMPNSPAVKSDIRAGDFIVKVEDIDVNTDTYQSCVDTMKGEKDTSVTLVVKRGDMLYTKTVTRDIISANNVTSEILDGNIGYIKIWAFENDVYKQFKEQYEDLQKKNIKGLVLDLRDNPGGLVSETTEIAKLLLPECEIVRLVYRDGNEKVYKSDNKNKIEIPLAVLVNSRSASAAEILSGAIKDSGVGVLVGNKTYGKGIVQTVEPLSDGNGALSITTAKYYTASGIEIHKNGIEPNVAVDLPDSLKDKLAIERQDDLQLTKAVEYINSNK